MDIPNGDRVDISARVRAGVRIAGLRRIRGGKRSIVARICALPGADEQGGALVEFALVLPALLMILSALLSFGLAFSNQVTLTQAVGSGAQYLQEIRTTTADPCKDTFTAIANASPILNPSSISVTYTLNGTSFGPLKGASANTCTSGTTDLMQQMPVTVQATYPCLLTIYGASFASGCNLSAKVTEFEY